MDTIQVEVTRDEFNELKSMYDKAVREKVEQFEFKGHPVLTSYAKYLIEYLEGRFNA